MRRCRGYLVLPFLAVLGTSLVGGTSFAFYRLAMGPEQCCKTHCRHPRVAKEAAERCCRTHLTAVPGAASKDRTGAVCAAASLAATHVTGAAPLPPAPAPRPIALLEGRAPPGALLTQHTALQL